jgi:hypothetical protein
VARGEEEDKSEGGEAAYLEVEDSDGEKDKKNIRGGKDGAGGGAGHYYGWEGRNTCLR